MASGERLMGSQRFTGRVAVITGASSGIGESTASLLAADGAVVALVARRADRLEALRARIAAAGGQAACFAADLTNDTTARTTIDAIATQLGRIDLLVNSAGILAIGPLDAEPPAEWRAMFDVNVLATLNATQAAVRHMKQVGGGHVVCVSSVLSRAVPAGNTGYAMTKAALNTFAEGLRKELIPHRIRVTNVAPGAVQTEITEHIADPELRANLRARQARAQMLQAVDVANAILYALAQPAHVAVNEILLRPAAQEF